MDKERCQSCGMPLGPGFFGTEADGSDTQVYCKFCYRDGAYVSPEMTMDEMLNLSVEQMVGQQGMPLEEATKAAHEVIPTLERWQTAQTSEGGQSSN